MSTAEHVAPVIDLSTRTRTRAHPSLPQRRKPADVPPATTPKPGATPGAGLVRVADMAVRAQRVLDDGVPADQARWWATQRDTHLTAMLLVAWPTSGAGVIRQAVTTLSQALESFQIRTPLELVSAVRAERP